VRRLGDPKKPRKKYVTPRKAWQADQLARELHLVGTYGLRSKRELWRMETELSRIRKQARMLLAAPEEERALNESKLLSYLSRIGIVGSMPTLDDVLGLTVEDLLERRLQTIVMRKGLASSIHHARQLIVHGHVKIGDRVVTVPSYIVGAAEEAKVRLREDSPLVKQLGVAAGQ